MKKVLVVLNTSVDSVYGASKSFRAHYDLLNKHYDFQVISQLGSVSKSDTCKFDHGAFFLLRNCLGFTFSVRENIFSFIKLVLGLVYLPILISKAMRSDIVHLNSLTLILYAPIIKIFAPSVLIICHIREILVKYKAIVHYCIRYVDKLVCIDEEVKAHLKLDANKNEVHVVSNPFVFDRVNDVFNFNEPDHVNIGIIGRISQEKNTKELLNYLNSKNYESELPIAVYIVGGAGADISYFIDCRKMIEQMSNVHYFGEVNDLENTNFYQKIDCLLRFDNHYSVGRTVLEAVNFGVDIYTSKKLRLPILQFDKICVQSRFFSLEESENFCFRKKHHNELITHSEYLEHNNKAYIKIFKEKLYA